MQASLNVTQHFLYFFSAVDHRKGVTMNLMTEPTVPTSVSWTKTTYLKCVEQALHNIATSPFYTVGKIGRAAAIVTCTETTPVSAFIPL